MQARSAHRRCPPGRGFQAEIAVQSGESVMRLSLTLYANLLAASPRHLGPPGGTLRAAVRQSSRSSAWPRRNLPTPVPCSELGSALGAEHPECPWLVQRSTAVSTCWLNVLAHRRAPEPGGADLQVPGSSRTSNRIGLRGITPRWRWKVCTRHCDSVAGGAAADDAGSRLKTGCRPSPGSRDQFLYATIDRLSEDTQRVFTLTSPG